MCVMLADPYQMTLKSNNNNVTTDEFNKKKLKKKYATISSSRFHQPFNY